MKMNKNNMLIAIGLIMIFVPLATIPEMAVLGLPWSDGFEDDFTNWEGTTTSPGNATLTTQTTIKDEGTKGAKCEIVYRTDWTESYCSQSFPEGPTVHIKAWFYIDSYTSEGEIRTLLGMKGQGHKWYSIGINEDRTLKVRYWDDNSYTESSSTTTVPSGIGFNLEFMVTVSQTNGQCKTWLNTVEVVDITKSGINCSLSGNMNKATFGIHSGYKTTAEIFMDSCVISYTYIGSSTPPPPTFYDLLVNSQPISGISYSVDSQTATTGTPKTLTAGSYTITMPSTVTSGGKTYSFESWNDAITNPVKQITLNSDLTITATYELQSNDTQPPEGKGILEVHAFQNASEIEVEFQIEGEGIFNTTSSGAIVELNPGSYIVTSTFNGETLQKTASINEGDLTRIDFQFGTGQSQDQQPQPTFQPGQIEEYAPMFAFQTFGIILSVIGIAGKKRWVKY